MVDTDKFIEKLNNKKNVRDVIYEIYSKGYEDGYLHKQEKIINKISLMLNNIEMSPEDTWMDYYRRAVSGLYEIEKDEIK